jgi:hypothetical protein
VAVEVKVRVGVKVGVKVGVTVGVRLAVLGGEGVEVRVPITVTGAMLESPWGIWLLLLMSKKVAWLGITCPGVTEEPMVPHQL